MKKLCLACIAAGFVFMICALAGAQEGGISASDVAGTPSEFAKVEKAPDPALLGGWKCVYQRFRPKTGDYEAEPVEFYLAKYGDKYGLYFYRSKPEGGGKVYRGWREFTIDGKEITSDTGIRFFTEGGKVFFSWERGQKDKPAEMTRIPGLDK